jgi:NAD(P)H-dependent flavin oxidoreductase YrpB (nitropropane dioxygenase family)
MKTPLTRMFNIDIPLFAFSHCRNVVAEVSKAGGMGVLGAAGFSAERLEEELRWLDAQGHPYGVDLLIPQTHQDVGSHKPTVDELIPASHRDFVNTLLDNAGVPRLPESDRTVLIEDQAREINMTPREAQDLLEVALAHPIKLFVNALGVPPAHSVKRLQAKGVRVGALVGSLAHARAQLEAGVDFIVAQGSEAGGHTGTITSMVLWPQVVDLAGNVPVLAAGGVGRGRQMAAAMALGAAGVWCGSVWLGTTESELDPVLSQRFFEARAEDAVQTRALTGKSCRALRSLYTDAWDRPGAPPTLPMPLQTLLWLEPRLRAQRAQARDWMSYPVGQLVGDLKGPTTTRAVIHGMLEEFLDSVEQLKSCLDDGHPAE